MAKRTCRECDQELPIGSRRDRIYCSKRCANRKHVIKWRKMNRDRRAEYFDRTCITCSKKFRSSRPTGKFCSDVCKGERYSLVMSTKCQLPSDHPVMTLIAIAKAERAAERKAEAESRRLAARAPDRRTSRECPTCACWFTPLRKSAAHMTYCSDRCGTRAARLRRRAREHNTLNQWTWSDFMRMARKFDYCCAYCGTKPDRLDPDHVVPLSRGGADALSNLLPVCLACNSDKSARLLHEWETWRKERGKPPLATSWHPDDRRYWHLTDTLLAVAS